MMLPNLKETIKKYKIWSLPKIVVVDTKGIIRKVMAGCHNDLEIQLRNLIVDTI